MKRAWMMALALAAFPAAEGLGGGAAPEATTPSVRKDGGGKAALVKAGACDGKCACRCAKEKEEAEPGVCKGCGKATSCRHLQACEACIEGTRTPLACACDGKHDHPPVEHVACPYCLKTRTGTFARGEPR